MTIQEKNYYRYNGVDYYRLEDVRTAIENAIGEILDKTPTRLPAKTAIEILDTLIDNRDKLVSLLSTDVEIEVIEDSHTELKGIFSAVDRNKFSRYGKYHQERLKKEEE